MAGSRRGRDPSEYRERMVELVRARRSPGSLAREFEPSEQTIHNWVRQAELDEGLRSDELTTEARKELRELKREVKRLRMERDIRKKSRGLAREGERIDPRRGYAFMTAHRAIFPLAAMYEVPVSPPVATTTGCKASPRRGRCATPSSRGGSWRNGSRAARPMAARGSMRRYRTRARG